MVPYLALFPLPNGPESGDTGTFSFVGTNPTHQDFFTTRVDHKFSDRDSLHGTYMNDDSELKQPDPYDLVLSALISRRHLATFEESHLFNPQLANFTRLGFSRVVSRAPLPLGAINPIAADTSLGYVPGKPVGTLTITGLTDFLGGVGSQSDFDYHYNSYQAYDDVFYTRQTHSLTFGFALERV